jgi:plastocyanin
VFVSAGGASATLGAAGATLQLTASAMDAGGSPLANVNFAWSSDTAGVATVDPATGLVTAQRSGIAGIRAAAGVTTSQPFPVTVVLPVAQVTVQPAAPVIPTGRSFTLGATATDGLGGTVPGVSYLWSSADPGHANVDAGGTVQAMLDPSGPGALGLGPIAISAADPVSGKSASAAASVAVYPTWSLATGMAGLTVDVAQGQYVIFANGDAYQSHSVVLDTEPIGTDLFTGDSAPLQAALAPGSYPFHCGVHLTMHGTLVVH